MKTKGLVIMVLLLICFAAGSVWAQQRQTYTVQEGDTLWGISERFYQDQSLWPKLWEMNRRQTANPHQITVGDKLVIYSKEELLAAPPSPPPAPKKTAGGSLYPYGEKLKTIFPKYFTYVADPEGIGGTGINRITVKKHDPLTDRTVVTYNEVREVGEIISSMETGYRPENEGVIHGKILLSYYDDVVVRFTDDVAKILDSASHEDPDPYFREFPIYGLTQRVVGPDEDRPDYEDELGYIHEFKGKLTVVARVETLAPMTEEQREELAESGGRNQDSEPVAYVAKITYSERPVEVGNKIFLFKSLYPGPDRRSGDKTRTAEDYRPPQP